jgi:hypothetical protein
MQALFRIPILFILLAVNANFASAQFAPAAGLPGSTAIWRDSSVLVSWASGCTVQRGYADVAQPDSGLTTVGDGNSATGAAGTNGVVSLGDGGTATLTFAHPIYNGPGFDFAVFENGFPTGETGLAFLEFAFVEVSSDGINFERFDAISHIQDTAQLPMVGIDCSLVNNLAGKYVNGYGTPFDLEELKDKPGLNVNSITHVRVVDVVGSVNSTYATYDSEGNKVNDPYPTPYPSGGFDLDAVGVIHALGVTAISDFGLEISDFKMQVAPNPVADGDVQLTVSENLIGGGIGVFNITGELLYSAELLTANCLLPTANLPQGLYFVTVANASNTITQKLVVR